jgi:hypothetical protein
MAGDDRTRFCGSCSKHVYNIASMTADEAKALIVETEGRVCLRIYKRKDGTVLTADCPVGLAKVAPGRRVRRALAIGLVLPALAVAGVTAKGMGEKPVEPFPTGPGTTWDDRIDWALITLGLKTPPPPVPTMTMGSPMPIVMGEPSAIPNLTIPNPGDSSTPVCPADEPISRPIPTEPVRVQAIPIPTEPPIVKP